MKTVIQGYHCERQVNGWPMAEYYMAIAESEAALAWNPDPDVCGIPFGFIKHDVHFHGFSIEFWKERAQNSANIALAFYEGVLK